LVITLDEAKGAGERLKSLGPILARRRRDFCRPRANAGPA
jgi:hypothetical protein